MGKSYQYILFIFLLLSSSLSQLSAYDFIKNNNAVVLNYGQSKDNIDIYRLGYQHNFSTEWFNSKLGYLSGYYEISLNYWKAENRDTNIGVAISPVFAYYFNKISDNFTPYIEAGIGASLFLKTHIARRDMSSAYLFEDRAGIGILTKEWNFEYRYMHYSNANIKQPNNGIDIFIFSIGKRF